MNLGVGGMPRKTGLSGQDLRDIQQSQYVADYHSRHATNTGHAISVSVIPC
jgi:hypothetical protein